jgi:hypothetical protein
VNRRPLLFAFVLLAGAAAIYLFLVRDTTSAPEVSARRAVATIGSGADAIAVTARGEVVPWLPLPEEPELPLLPLSEPPKSGRLAGPMLQQAHILGAAPEALRPYLASSYYGESGVDVETTAGIELRFGDGSRARKKWRAVAAVLADPEIVELDYVNAIAPGSPAYGGSGHTLPPSP